MNKLDDRRVIPLDELLLDRRGFCRTIAGTLGAAGVAACAASTGCGSDGLGYAWPAEDAGADSGISGTRDMAMKQSGPPDMAMKAPPADLAVPRDMTKPKPDLAQANGNCPQGVFDTGQEAPAFALNTATFFGNEQVFVCRDANGLYCLSSICTHAGCNVEFQPKNNDRFYCPCHGSTFTFTGAVTGGPANGPLVHYALCVSGNKAVGFDLNTTVSPATRYNF